MGRIILGLDPGTRQYGWGVVERVSGANKHVAHGVIKLPARLTTPAKLVAIRDEVLRVVLKYKPEAVGVETPFMQYANVIARLSEARGVSLLVAQDHALDIYQWPPAQMRARIGLKGNAKKTEVAALVRLELGLGGLPLEFDETDALALALACPETVIHD
jgi:crossover junction endodeoxyribonuclease RuvC